MGLNEREGRLLHTNGVASRVRTVDATCPVHADGSLSADCFLLGLGVERRDEPQRARAQS